MAREIDVRAYRVLVRFSLLFALAFIVLALFQFLPNAQEAFDAPPRIGEDRPQLRIGIGLVALGLGIVTIAAPQYFRIRPDPAAENLLVLVTKRDCSLCDEARHVIREVAKDTPFTLEEVDLEANRHLRRFKNFIPVLFWQGDELARLRVDPDALRARLQAILAEREARRRALEASPASPKGV